MIEPSPDLLAALVTFTILSLTSFALAFAPEDDE